uniref:Legumain prodomain domain-containing protein n=1 Tax=Strombidium inclinatum TaxID=197538 RepID=A0A7S3IIS0_9SPIT|mmetsp:Transcript_21646/g.33310  ORF Transcript_21646/g.33310 Transcript_21646/m.33310 type:complete len:297 (+) Transcript_21646:494-1384(+)
MYADKLHEDFQYMFENKMYNQMTVYIEACESGSMFENILEDNMNIYAVTAANSTESSWGTYCSPNDKVNGKKIKSCLGDLFSVNWLEDSDKADMAAESLQQQYSAVRDLTTKSEVLQWGEVDFTAEPIGEFQSGGIPAEKTVSESLWNQIKHKTPKMIKDMFEINAESQRKALSAVSSRDIDLHFWYNIAVDEPTEENLQALQDYITYRKKVDDTVEAIFGTEFMSNLEGTKNLPTDFECYRTMINKFQEQCFEADGYNMKYYKAFVAHCEFAKNFPEGEELVQKTLDKMDEVCQH